MLNRKELQSCSPAMLFGDLPAGRYLNSQELNESLQATLAAKPDDQPIWIFTYGSLMWNPVIRFSESHTGTLHNWERAFCMRLDSGRATPGTPGRMLALVPGNKTQGLVCRLNESSLEEDLSLLWTREMCTGSYIPRWERIALNNGDTVTALVFVMSSGLPAYEDDYLPESIAPLITRASGPLGSNADYLHQLNLSLFRMGIRDRYITELAEAVRNIGFQ